MQVTAVMVKVLRERTGAGMMECKKFLTEASGDMERAVELLRKSGQIKADKKSGRIAAEGVVMAEASPDGGAALLVEINCETDFVARDESFRQFCRQTAHAALDGNPADVAALKSLEIDGETIEDLRRKLVTKIGENVQLRRFTRVAITGGVCGIYLHGVRIGVIVDMEGGDQALARDIAMHIAASRPLCISAEDAPTEVVAKEKAILTEQAEESGKPPDIIERMVSGRLKKYLAEITLLNQAFVKDTECTVGELLKRRGAAVRSFHCYEIGEGMEKKKESFAEEVMAQVEGR